MDDNEQQAGTEVSEQPAGVSETATEVNEGSQEQEGKTTEQEGSNALTPQAQEIVNNAIGRQHKKFREQETRADELQVENDRLRALTSNEQRPEIPPMLDQMDENYEHRIEQRETAIRDRTEFDLRAEQASEQARYQAGQQAQDQQQAFVDAATAYTAKAKVLGVDPAALDAAGKTVHAYGLPDAITQHLLVHDKGPLITQYLASNLAELEALRQMDPISAGVRIATEIVPRIPTAPGTTGAPPPAESVDGKGAPPKVRGPEGCTYE
jgi:hypothetical protein